MYLKRVESCKPIEAFMPTSGNAYFHLPPRATPRGGGGVIQHAIAPDPSPICTGAPTNDIIPHQLPTCQLSHQPSQKHRSSGLKLPWCARVVPLSTCQHTPIVFFFIFILRHRLLCIRQTMRPQSVFLVFQT